MKNFVAEFKAFAIKGNVIDLAVAVVIGAAFGKIVSSLVTNIITPLIGVLLGGIDFTTLELKLGESAITYGVFLQSIFDFIVIAFVIFLAIKAVKKIEAELESDKEEETKKAAPVDSEEVKLLREIRDSLNRN